MSDHLLVTRAYLELVSDLFPCYLYSRELIPLGALNSVVKDQDCAVVGGLEDEYVLGIGLVIRPVSFLSYLLTWYWDFSWCRTSLTFRVIA